MNNVIENSDPDCRNSFRFHWLREDSPNGVSYDAALPVHRSDLILAILGLHPGQLRPFGEGPLVERDHLTAVLQGSVPLASLPLWAIRRMSIFLGPLDNDLFAGARDLLTTAAQIRAVAAPSQGRIDLHLPFIRRRDWPFRRAMLNSADYCLDRGRILPRAMLNPGPQSSEYLARLIGVSATASTGGVLRYRLSRGAPGLLMNALLPVGEAPDPLGCHAEAGIDLALRAEACRAWYNAPPERHTEYFPMAAQVSRALQSALRRWSAFWWLSDPGRLERIPASWAVMAYRSGTVFAGKRRTEYTYDTLSTDWYRPFFRHARKPLAALLRPVRAELLRTGERKLAAQYYPAHRKYILERVRRQRRLLHDLVTGEGAIVNDILRFGLDLRGAQPRTAALAGAKCAARLGQRLRYTLPGFDFGVLIPVLLFEATNAVHLALGGENALETSVEVYSHEDPAAPLSACA